MDARKRDRDPQAASFLLRPPHSAVAGTLEAILLATSLLGLAGGSISYFLEAERVSRWAFGLSVFIVLLPTTGCSIQHPLRAAAICGDTRQSPVIRECPVD
jgi:hypothetical protein